MLVVYKEIQSAENKLHLIKVFRSNYTRWTSVATDLHW